MLLLMKCSHLKNGENNTLGSPANHNVTFLHALNETLLSEGILDRGVEPEKQSEIQKSRVIMTFLSCINARRVTSHLWGAIMDVL